MLSNMEIHELECVAERLPITEIISRLSALLGPKLTVFLSGENDVLILGAWVAGERKPNPTVCLRLRFGYIAAAILTRNHDLETARTAFMGMNRYLDGEAPASYLRSNSDFMKLRQVIGAARMFGEMGG